MSWYRGRYVFTKRNLAQWMAASNKDYHFRVRHKDQADKTVVSFVYSDQVKKDRRLYCACRVLYDHYQEYCQQQELTPLNNHNFKRNMELLGFIYQKHHRFYVGYYGNKVTTAYKNIGIVKQ
ncbi:hypothetical protein [Limosilactobacillus secaliphilus]|uniref:hypothetical protein n=1 Tax=Limosilactobacillus secaliphilus TaxID=396268 RepID=UPI00070AA439|nr:hypothetical protein [Limosilactobacillus secaliphilus]